MMHRALLALGLLSLPAMARHPKTGFLNRSVTIRGTEYLYQVYVPADWTSQQKWPVILFLHGSGERGDDGEAQAKVGIGAAIRQHPEKFPAVVVMPQCRNGERWTEPAMEALSMAALDRSIKEFHGDLDRVYLTGLSMGGFGSWALAAKYPEKWAAAVIICGGIRRRTDPPIPDEDAGKLYAEAAGKIGTKLPVWVFHGAADGTVPVTESRKMVAALKEIGSDVKYTEYEGVEHNSWDKAYAEPDLPAWLFAQHRSAATSGT